MLVDVRESHNKDKESKAGSKMSAMVTLKFYCKRQDYGEQNYSN